MSGRKFAALLAMIVAVGLLGRLAHFRLSVSPDEDMYVQAAKLLSHPDAPTVPEQYRQRILWLWTLNAWGKVAGLSVKSVSVLMFLFSAGAMLLTAAIARKLFGNLAGLFAAATVAVYYASLLYDPRIKPDVEAVFVLLLSVLCFLRYLASGSRFSLGTAAVLAGLLLGIKEYYIIMALPFAWALWFSHRDGQNPAPSRLARLKDLGLAAALFVLAAASISLLHWLASGDPLAQFRSTHYAERLTLIGSGVADASWHWMLFRRFNYFRYLLLENGIVGGLLLVAGGIYLAAWSRRNDGCRLLLHIVLVFLLFLSLAPASFHPFFFVETSPKYMLAFIPFLAIGAGGAIADVVAHLHHDRALLACAWSLGLMAAAVNLCLPNYRFASPAHGTSSGDAWSQIAKLHEQYGFTAVLLPWWDWPDKTTAEIYDRKPPVILAGHGTGQSTGNYGQIESILAQHPDAAVFVPAWLIDDKNIMPLNCNPEFRKIPLFAPGSSLSAWTSAVKGQPGDTVVAYLFAKHAAPAK